MRHFAPCEIVVDTETTGLGATASSSLGVELVNRSGGVGGMQARWVISARVYRGLDERDSARGTTPNWRIRDYGLLAASDSAS